MDHKKLFIHLSKKRNVVGISKELKPRIKNGKVIENEKVLRVYVIKKLPESCLAPEDIIPKTIDDIPTDVVEIGEVRALDSPTVYISSSVDKTKKFRPVKLGVSVGHWGITAGTLGMLYEYNGEILAGSNAHVLTPDGSLHPEQILEKRICQPGPYHDSNRESNVVGQYYWHERIIPTGESSTCPISNAIIKGLNWIARIVGSRTRFKLETLDIFNHQDFAVYKPLVEHELTVADGSLTNEPFIGHLFAGSSSVGIICKVKYAIGSGYNPLIEPYTEIQDGDIVKGCSFWCNYQTTVTDSSAICAVGYGNFSAVFEDVIIVQNSDVIRGGWSGSGFRYIER